MQELVRIHHHHVRGTQIAELLRLQRALGHGGHRDRLEIVADERELVDLTARRAAPDLLGGTHRELLAAAAGRNQADPRLHQAHVAFQGHHPVAGVHQEFAAAAQRHALHRRHHRHGRELDRHRRLLEAAHRALEALVAVRSDFCSAEAIREAEWSKLRRLDFQEAVRARDSYALKTQQHTSLRSDASFTKQYAMVARYKEVTLELERLVRLQSDENLELLPDYHQRVNVLKTLRYIDPVTESVLLKGRVACEVNSANELVLTELILENVLVEYEPDPEEILRRLIPDYVEISIFRALRRSPIERLVRLATQPGSRELHAAFVGRPRTVRLSALVRDYPALARAWAQLVEDWVEATAELVLRLEHVLIVVQLGQKGSRFGLIGRGRCGGGRYFGARRSGR